MTSLRTCQGEDLEDCVWGLQWVGKCRGEISEVSFLEMKEEGAGELVLGGLGLCSQQEVEEGGAVGAVGQDRWDLEHMVRGLPHDSPTTSFWSHRRVHSKVTGPLSTRQSMDQRTLWRPPGPHLVPQGCTAWGLPPGPMRKAGIHSGLRCPHEALGSKRAPA